MQPRPKKSLGQHFLNDARISARIVDLLHMEPHDQVLEVGPGPGALTGLIAAKAPARLMLLEKDDHWARVHARNLEAMPGASVHPMDALSFDWTQLEGPWKCIGNLPYNVASPLIWDMVSRIPRLERAVFMVQKEVAERLAAVPGNRDYGGLSVWVQSFVRVEWGFVVGPGSFTPPPRVDSAVVAMLPLAGQDRPPHPEALAAVVRMCFQQRRKQLQSILRNHHIPQPAALLEELGIAPEARPETLTCIKFHALAAKLSGHMLTSTTNHD